MPEYIEREDLLKDIDETVVFTVRKGVYLPTAEMRGANKVIDRIKSAPVADVVEKLQSEKHDLENLVAINKGAMRAYREALENSHDEAVKDFSYFLIDKAKDGCIEICDLPDLVAEWSSPARKDAELMKEINAFFDEAAETMKPSSEGISNESWVRTPTGCYDARFTKV